MSLTSRISNIFSSSPAPHLAPADGHNPPDIDRHLGVSVDHGAIHEKRTESRSRHALDEEEEEGRPPYLHVSDCVAPECYSAPNIADHHAVDDCWWYWRHDRRSLDALNRYSQNAATGRHTHSSQVPNLIVRIRHHRPSGRYSAGSV